MKKKYRIAGKGDTRKIAEFLAANGELLLPMVELIESSRMAVGELVDMLGRASIEAVLRLSARGVAGEKHQGREGTPAGTAPSTALSTSRIASCG